MQRRWATDPETMMRRIADLEARLERIVMQEGYDGISLGKDHVQRSQWKESEYLD